MFVRAIKNAVHPVTEFARNALEQFVKLVGSFESLGIRELMDKFEPVANALGGVSGVIEAVESALAPVMWVLECIGFLVNSIFKPVMDFIMNSLGLGALVDSIAEQLNKVLGIDSVRKYLDQAMNAAFNNILGPLDGELQKFDCVEQVQKLSSDFQAFRKSPADGIVKMLNTVINSHVSGHVKVKPIGGDNPMLVLMASSFPEHETQSPMIVEGVQSDSVDQVISRRQHRLDRYVSRISSALVQQDVHGRKVQHVTLRTAFFGTAAADEASGQSPLVWASPATSAEDTTGIPVRLGYAYYKDLPVSMLLRTQHPRILDAQKSARDTPLKPFVVDGIIGNNNNNNVKISQTTFGVDEPTIALSLAFNDGSPSGGKSDHFDAFCVRRAKFQAECEKALELLARLLDVAQQADHDFATFSPESVAFGGHLTAMFGGIDPLLSAVETLISLPLDYLGQMKKLLQETLGAPTAVLAVVDDIGGDRDAALKRAADVSTEYVKVQQAVSTACSTDRLQLASHLGASSSVHDITSLVRLLTHRLGTTATNFEAMENLGRGIYEDYKTHPERYSANFFTKLDSVYEGLAGTVASTSAEVRDLVQQQGNSNNQGVLVTLYAALSGVHDDVRRFFQASQAVSELCTAVESSVIATDAARETCVRFANMVEPLKHILTEVGVSIDPKQPVGPQALADTGLAVVLQKMVTAAALDGTKLFLERAFHLGDINKGMDDIMVQLQNTLEKERIPALDKAVLDLVAKVTPTKLNAFALPPGGISADDETVKTFTVMSPLLDQGTADMMGQLLIEIKRAASDQSPPLSWAGLTWCRRWDEAEPAFPSVIFMEWYQTLQDIDLLVNKRRGVLPDPSSSASPALASEPPSGTNPAFEMWKQLGAVVKTDMIDAYDSHLGEAHWIPIHDRINQLLHGIIKLPATAGTDLLQTIKRRPDTTPLPTPYVLPTEATELAEKTLGETGENGKKALADDSALRGVWRDQQRFEQAAVQLAPFGLTPTNNVGLEGLHHGYNLLGARELLANCGDEDKTHQYARLTGCEVEGKGFASIPVAGSK
ncbi:hypothetical protein CDEST_00006 [Colletotrichum destructivum]|uniref:Uncharacterized protein n=1 Tax=Colletotrichum destructivum TaxID=34406 RepID=A0AAX4HVD1_9PEZI|nr:hypothetical protein CDEST_00006 [Colletotrichum destructivum]